MPEKQDMARDGSSMTDVVIAGAGPAGMTAAALLAARRVMMSTTTATI